jgi:hypothetical protein
MMKSLKILVTKFIFCLKWLWKDWSKRVDIYNEQIREEVKYCVFCGESPVCIECQRCYNENCNAGCIRCRKTKNIKLCSECGHRLED